MKSSTAIKQLGALKKITTQYSKKPRLAAEGWNENWKTLIAIMLSAQTRDTKTIEVCENLFKKYNTLKKLRDASLSKLEKETRTLNYYKTKTKNIKRTAGIVAKKGIPDNVEQLIELPGVGRKTANVFLAETKNAPAIGVDTHVKRISKKLGWTKNSHPHKIEKDLEKLFHKIYWNSINYILVSFGQTIGKSRAEEDKLLKRIRDLK